MFRNYSLLAIRNILRKKFYSVINLAGLSIASAFCILVYLYVKHEQSFDKFHTNASQLYRLEQNNLWQSDEKKKSSFFSFMLKDEEPAVIQHPAILSGELEKAFPEIEQTVRIQQSYQAKVRVGAQSFEEKKNIAYVDKNFFTVFSFPLLRGNPANALAEKNNIVISENVALKYFGNTDPIGRTILLPNDDSAVCIVSAVAKNFPTNSSYRFDLLMPRTATADYAEKMSTGLNTSSDQIIIQLKKGVDAASFEKRLDAFTRRYYEPALKEWAAFPGSAIKIDNFHVHIRPFADAHYSPGSGWGHFTDLKNIYQLISLAIVILIIACLNYILLTLTGTVSRSQEVGIRKTIGAERKQLVLQFYIETQMLAFISVIVGLVLAIVCLPFFNSLTGSEINIQFFSGGNIILLLCSLAVALGIIAGVYPALVMSGLKPLNMLRKLSAYKLNPYLSGILVTTQFSVCIILIISTLAINKQIAFINHKDLGFDKEQIITLNNPFSNANDTRLLKERLENFAATNPSIAGFSNTYLGYNNVNSYRINDQKTMVEVFDIDYNYFSFFKIPIIKGRNFSRLIPEDSAKIQLAEDQYMKGASATRQAVIVNETLYKILGSPELNTINASLGGRIIGVCKDYYPDDLTKAISPSLHRIEKWYGGSFSFKIRPNQNMPQVLDRLHANWNKLTGGEPFSYSFLDETVAQNYDAYLRWMKTVTAACVLAIFIACMGLFGLSGLSTTARIKEIGIRKVLGASVSDLFLLLNKGMLITAFVAFVIAIPIALLLVNAWLQNFAYRIAPDWSLFVGAGVISLATAIIAVSYHTIKTAIANPVKSLRTE